MSSRGLSSALAQVGRGVVSADTETTDGQLLTRYIQTRDEPAFTELLRRLAELGRAEVEVREEDGGARERRATLGVGDATGEGLGGSAR